MTINEFKAYLEGMDVQGAPTDEQWSRIKGKIDALEPFRVVSPPHVPGTYETGFAPMLMPHTTCLNDLKATS